MSDIERASVCVCDEHKRERTRVVRERAERERERVERERDQKASERVSERDSM